MHAKIIQLSSEPIEEEDYLTMSDCYEDLDKIEPFGADYVDDVSEEEADEIIFNILNNRSDILEVNMKKRTVRLKDNPDWTSYKKKFDEFKKKVQEMSFEDFITDKDICTFKTRKFCKTISGTETCFQIDGSYQSENDFLGQLLYNKEKPLYIGGVVDYHF